MLSNQRLKDRVALVTGGARGVGEALAHKLAAEGAKVVVGEYSYFIVHLCPINLFCILVM